MEYKDFTIKVPIHGMKEYCIRLYDNGDKEWRVDNLLHREGGPAIEYANGKQAFFLKGEELSQEEYNDLFDYSDDDLLRDLINKSYSLLNQHLITNAIAKINKRIKYGLKKLK